MARLDHPNKQKTYNCLCFTATTHTLTFTHSLSQQCTSINSIYWTDFGSICSIYWWYWCCLRWFLRLLSGLLAKCSRLPLPVPPGERTTLPEKFSLSEVCARSLDTREWQKKSQRHWMGSTDPTLPILCTFLPLPRLWISIFGIELGHFMPFTFWISIFGYELCLSLPCLGWMSTWFALLAYLVVWN